MAGGCPRAQTDKQVTVYEAEKEAYRQQVVDLKAELVEMKAAKEADISKMEKKNSRLVEQLKTQLHELEVRTTKERASLEAANAELRRENDRRARKEGGVVTAIRDLELKVSTCPR
eukprot:251790-Prorocentrum_minimum.AAC.4